MGSWPQVSWEDRHCVLPILNPLHLETAQNLNFKKINLLHMYKKITPR
jgi:hypothetical protein